jgi:hypothetical protein
MTSSRNKRARQLAWKASRWAAAVGVVCQLAGGCVGGGGGGGVAESVATIRGTVASFEGGSGANVDVSVAETDVGSTTADDGFFIMSGVPPGDRRVVFARGASSGSLRLHVPPRSTIELTNVRVNDGEAEPDDIDVKINEDDDSGESGGDGEGDDDSGAGGGDGDDNSGPGGSDDEEEEDDEDGDA